MNLLLRGRLEIVTRPGALFSPFLDSLRSPASLGKRVRTGEAPLQRFPCCRREWRGTGLSVQLSAIGDYLLMQNRYRDTKNSHDISQRGSISSPPPSHACGCMFIRSRRSPTSHRWLLLRFFTFLWLLGLLVPCVSSTSGALNKRRVFCLSSAMLDPAATSSSGCGDTSPVFLVLLADVALSDSRGAVSRLPESFRLFLPCLINPLLLSPSLFPPSPSAFLPPPRAIG